MLIYHIIRYDKSECHNLVKYATMHLINRRENLSSAHIVSLERAELAAKPMFSVDRK
jgi:hypothetical protein